MLVKTRLYVGFLGIALVGLVLAMSSFLSFGNISHEGIELGIYKAPLVDASMEIKLNALMANILFEDIIADRSNTEIDEVWNLLNDTYWFANVIKEGGTKNGRTYVPADNENIYTEIDLVIEEINLFREAAEIRYTRKQNTDNTDLEMEAAFEGLYSELVSQMDRRTDDFVRSGEINMVRTMQSLRFQLADSHLMLAELLGGEGLVSIDSIMASFESTGDSLALIHRMYGSSFDNMVLDLQTLIDMAGMRANNYLANRKSNNMALVQYNSSYDAFLVGADVVEEMIHDLMVYHGDQLYANSRRGYIFISIISLLGILIAFVLAIVFSRQISGPLLLFRNLFSQGASGDLSVRSNYNGHDEIGQLSLEFNGFMSRLEEIIVILNGNRL